MLKLLKNGELYSPEFLGKMDVLIANNKIAAIGQNLSASFSENIDFEIIDCSEKIITPGFIDGHVHITGGGGEGGFKTRTPEISLVDITTCGVTTVIGCLGTDGITRSMEALYAKAKALEEEGISTYIFSGSYRIPPVTITGDIMKDLLMIDKVIGSGEIAISDHRSSQPALDDLKHLAANVRVGGILSGKAGVICFHVGDGMDMLDKIKNIVESTEISFSQFLPTHMNRNQRLFEESIQYAKAGGFIDFTTSSNPNSHKKSDLSASRSLKLALAAGVSEHQITFTSDGQGSLPVFDDAFHLIRLDIGRVSSLYEEFKAAVLSENVPLETALKVITSNPADLFKLNNKGRLQKGLDADFVILNKEDLAISTVIAMGKTMIRDTRIEVFGTFA
jgi:beta-aspartyl-dipeptidase (metallo-type)